MFAVKTPQEVASWLNVRVLAHYRGGFDLATKAHDKVIKLMLCMDTLIEMLPESKDFKEFMSSLEECGFLAITTVHVHKSLLAESLFALAQEGLAAKSVESKSTDLALFGETDHDDPVDPVDTDTETEHPPATPLLTSLCGIPVLDTADFLQWRDESGIEGQCEGRCIQTDDYVITVWLPKGSSAIVSLDRLIAEKCPYWYRINYESDQETPSPIVITPVCTGCPNCNVTVLYDSAEDAQAADPAGSVDPADPLDSADPVVSVAKETEAAVEQDISTPLSSAATRPISPPHKRASHIKRKRSNSESNEPSIRKPPCIVRIDLTV